MAAGPAAARKGSLRHPPRAPRWGFAAPFLSLRSSSGALTHGAAAWHPFATLPNFAIIDHAVATMNVSIPDDLKSFVETQVATEGYGTSSEYVRELIRRDRQRNQLRRLILDGLAVGTSHPVDDAFGRF